MSEGKEVRDIGQGMELVTIAAEDPQIFDKVQYVYTSYARYMVTASDVRLALGDRVPPNGEVRPVVGIIMSHENAKAFVEASAKILKALDAVKSIGGEPESQGPQPPMPKVEVIGTATRKITFEGE